MLEALDISQKQNRNSYRVTDLDNFKKFPLLIKIYSSINRILPIDEEMCVFNIIIKILLFIF